MQNCINCKKQYETKDEEAYYCPPCLMERKAMLAEIDKKHPPQPAPEYNKLSVEDRFKNWAGKNTISKIGHY